MRERKLHQELSEMDKLLAVLIETSGGQVEIAARTIESLPHDIEIWREELPQGFRLKTIHARPTVKPEVEEQVEGFKATADRGTAAHPDRWYTHD